MSAFSVIPSLLRGGCVASFVFLICTSSGHGESWPRFRGGDATGVAADDPRLPDRWSRTDNVLWEQVIPGWGWSSPVAWGNKVFVTAVASDAAYETPKKGLYLGRGRKEPPKGIHRWLTYCLDTATGQVLWTQQAHEGEPRASRHPKSTYASETPVTDGERVYVLFGDVGLYCYGMDGEPQWKVPIAMQPTFYDYGAAGSPVVHKNQVILVYDNQEASYIAAYDTVTGNERWRASRDEKSTWATPFIWENEFRTEIVTAGKKRIRSYDLDGNHLWYLEGRMSNLIIPSPFAAHGMVYVTSGYVGDSHRPVFAIQPGASGDISLDLDDGETRNEFVKWYEPKLGPYNTSPTVYQGIYYTLYDRGLMSANDAVDGSEHYDRERFPRGATFTASPWAYNDRVFCLSEDGVTYVLKAGPEFEILYENDLDEMCMASPAVIDGKLLLRTASRLYCFETKR